MLVARSKVFLQVAGDAVNKLPTPIPMQAIFQKLDEERGWRSKFNCCVFIYLQNRAARQFVAVSRQAVGEGNYFLKCLSIFYTQHLTSR